MRFSDKSRQQLEKMGIKPDKYASDIFARFQNDAFVIEQLISHFLDYSTNDLTKSSFNKFIDNSSINCESSIYNHCFDIFNYLRMYKDGGKFNLFKGRQSEWDGPIVVLEKADVPASNLESLKGIPEIYRGMSLTEFQSSKFGQSWTTDISVARKFAFETYSEKPRGIVAKAQLDIRNAIYYSLRDSESEVIMLPESILFAEKIET